jgi:hypothetical protein
MKDVDGHQYVFPVGETTLRMSSHLQPIVDKLYTSYSKAFPDRPPVNICLSIEKWNGGNGSWTVARSDIEGPLFFVRISDELSAEEFEVILAHELSHPIVRLVTGRGAKSIPPVDQRFANELSSTSQHPFVFDILDQNGYGEAQRSLSERYVAIEIDRLRNKKHKDGLYNQIPQQVWSALWYFNFYLLAPEGYEQIKAFHRERNPGMYNKMMIVEDQWKKLKKYRDVGDYIGLSVEFSDLLHKNLDLQGRVRFTSKAEWESFLFGK